MKRLKLLTLITLCLFLLVYVNPSSVVAQDAEGYIASPFKTGSLDITDSAIDTNWDNVSNYVDVTAFGENGLVKFAHNETHLFTLVVADKTKDWIAFEFDADTENCMIPRNDGWSMYFKDNDEVQILDTKYAGAQNKPDNDTDSGGTNDLMYEVVTADGYHSIELVRPMDTGDSSGYDIAYEDAMNVFVKFASNDHHILNEDGNGPSPTYYLSIQFGDEVVEPDVPKVIDYKFWKFVVQIGVIVAALGFMAMHFTVRMVVRPLDQCARIVDEKWEKPTLKSRWENTFGEDDMEEN